MEVLKHITINRIEANKPTIIFVTGDSGEGKSYTALKLAQAILRAKGLDLKDYIDDLVIYTPLEYTEKLNKILFDKNYKDVKVLILDEARDIIKAKKWQSYINQAISDINAQSRGVKPIVTIIVSQFIGDIDKDVRRTITYYGAAHRPMKMATRFKLFRVWKDDWDIEAPKLRKRPLKGVIRRSDGRTVKLKNTFKVLIPEHEVKMRYERSQREAKTKVIKQRMELLLKELQKEFKDEFSKVDSMVDWYVQHPDNLKLIIETKRRKVRLRKEVQQMHDLTSTEAKEFEKRLKEKLVERGLLGMETKSETQTNT